MLSGSPIATASGTTTATMLTQIYSGYAVAAVTGGVTSQPTIAFTLVEGCIHIILGPPPGFSIGCTVGSPLPVHAELMVSGRNLVD
jgi:hypothetical protein